MTSSESFLEKYTREFGVLKTLDEYEKNQEQKVLRTLTKKLSGSTSIIEGFNNWYENVFEEQITSKSFEAPDGSYIKFLNPKLGNPKIIINGKEEILYPHYCRENTYPYTGIITVDCEVTKKNGEKITTSLELGRLPIMVGSIKCNLYGKSEEELIGLNECVSDPFGYFILKTERSITTQDKGRMKIPLIYVEKSGKLECHFTSGKYGKTKKFVLTTGKKWLTIKLNDYYGKTNNMMDVKNLPIFIVFKVLENLGPEEALEKYILKFVPEKFKRRSRNILNSSIIKMKNIPDFVEYICNKRKIKFTYQKRNELFKEFKSTMLENFFPDIKSETEENSIFLKLNMYGFLVTRYILTIIDVIKPDSRDSWINKRFDSAGAQIEILLTSCLNSVIQQCKREINKFSTSPDYSVFGNTMRSKSSSSITRDFNRSFNTDTWGASIYGKMKKQVTETTQRATPVAIWSQSTKTNNPSSRRIKKFDIREVHPSQRDKHCLIETPEGINVGMVKYTCITNRYSLDTDENIPINYIKEKVGNMGDVVDGKKCDIIFLINGKFVSILEKGIEIVYCHLSIIDDLREAKRTGKISFDTEICYDKTLNSVQVYTDSSRATSPYLVFNETTHRLVIEELDAWEWTYDELLTSGAIEFLSPKECDNESTLICYSVQKYRDFIKELDSLEGFEKDSYLFTRNYSHCNIDPIQCLSVAAATGPLLNRQNGAKSLFQSSMVKQALGYFNTNYHVKFYGKREGFKRLHKGTRSFVETDVYYLPKLDIMPCGQTAMIAFLTDPDNQEDAVIVSEDFINSGNLNYVKYVSVFYSQSSFPVGVREYIQKPDISDVKNPEIYSNIGEDGMPILDSFINEGDCVLGKVLKSKDGKIVNNSLKATTGESGYVDRIIKTREKENGNILIKIRLRQTRKYRAGDKLAIRYAQKGTIGRIDKKENMIRVADGPNKGIVPDIIFNPLGFPSRQTCGLLLEGLLTKAALYDGKRVDFTAFREVDIEGAQRTLREVGLDENGHENMEFPDGTPLLNKVFFVPIYEQVLKHQVMDKIQMRSNGTKSLYTHQPKGGRAQGGGQKIGEMEKDAFVSHGASGVILERMMKVSDEFKLVICQSCGSMINNRICNVCDDSNPGVLTIPYVFKLLINLLNGTGIDIRINTEPVKLGDE